jgi:DNA-binding CsgD family transcriptional regulator
MSKGENLQKQTPEERAAIQALSLAKRREQSEQLTTKICQLRAEGLSIGQIQQKLKRPLSTIKWHLRKLDKKDIEHMNFAEKLTKLAQEAPSDYCRTEVFRTVKFIRTHIAISIERKQEIILQTLETEGDADIQTLVETTKYSREEIETILVKAIEEKKVVDRAKSGVGNRGRRRLKVYSVVSDWK